MALGWLGVALRVHWRGPSARLPQASLISRGPAQAGGAPASLKVIQGELSHVCPVSVRCRDGASAMRHGLHRLARREAAQRCQGGSPRLKTPDPGNLDEATDLPSPALAGTLSPSDGEREGVRGLMAIP